MARSEDLPIALGVVLDGKYLVERVIGQGGMGVVYAGSHVALARLVAVKVMRPSLSVNEDAVARFDREARAASLLTSAHVARVLDVGRSPEGDPYIVMEHLVGTTLQGLIARGPLAPSRIVSIALDIVDALAEAHAAGIIHRDLKPANVFLVGESAKVLDFGIAKVEGSLGEGGNTTTGSVLGTPEYMAPEQLDTKRGVTTKTDVWSLGVTMYYALTKKTPFEADSFYELSVKVYAHEPTPITKHRADLPPGLVALIGGCLQKDAKKRLALEVVAERLVSLREEHVEPHDSMTDGSPLEAETPTRLGAPRRPEAHAPSPESAPTRVAPVRADTPLLDSATVERALLLDSASLVTDASLDTASLLDSASLVTDASLDTASLGMHASLHVDAPDAPLVAGPAPYAVEAPPRRVPVALIVAVAAVIVAIPLAIALAGREPAAPVARATAQPIEPVPLDQPSVVAATPLPAAPTKNVPPAHASPARRRPVPAPAAPKDSGALTHER